MTDTFAVAMGHVFKWEGGLSDHPLDPGGLTNLGVTWATYRDYFGPLATKDGLRALTKPAALEIYRARYWRLVRGDDLPAALAILVMDAAVNSGPANAARALQRAINTTTGARLKVDGQIGPKTLAALALEDPHPGALVREYAARRMVFYGALKTFQTFGLGWSRRLIDGLALAVAQPCNQTGV